MSVKEASYYDVYQAIIVDGAYRHELVCRVSAKGRDEACMAARVGMFSNSLLTARKVSDLPTNKAI